MGLRDLAEQYSLVLREYCADRDEAALFRAYELGRRAAFQGLGVLEMAAMHQDALMAALLDVDVVCESTLIVESACELFAECLAPFELTRRVYQDRARAVARSRKPGRRHAVPRDLEVVPDPLVEPVTPIAVSLSLVKSGGTRG